VTSQLDDAEREQIERLVPQVRRMASRMHRRHPSIDFDDFLSAGQEATVLASDRWTEAKGRFGPFALTAAYYAMFDLARATFESRKRELQWLRQLALFDDEQREGFLVSPMPSLAGHDWEADRRSVLRDLRGRLGAALALLPAEPANDGEDEFLRARAMTIGRGVIDETAASFGEPDRTYFVRHFREGKSLEEIATELGLTRKAARIVADRVHERLGEALRAAKVG
jgi:RNA polymerase sigma factor (sigma-70 family)